MIRNDRDLGGRTLGEESLKALLLDTTPGGDRARCRVYLDRTRQKLDATQPLRLLDSGGG